MFQRIGDALRSFMYGRNGVDKLAWAELIVGIVLNLIGSFTGLSVFTIIAYVPLVFALLRIFSRNLDRCQQQNDAFLQFFARIRGRKTYRYFRCPNCKTTVKVPRGKGKVRITCPTCKTKFEKKA